MIIYLIVLQLVVPLGLLTWLAIAPPRSIAGYAVHVLAIGLLLVALRWAGMWLVPPWWTLHVLTAVWVTASLVAWKRLRHDTTWPRSVAAWSHVVVFTALGAFASWLAITAWAGHRPADVTVIELGAPLRGGPYFVTSGGSSINVNAHIRTLHPTTARMAAHRGQSYAVDLIMIDRAGLRARGLQPTDPHRYHIYGQPVYAPCTGVVAAAVDRWPDMQVPQMDTVSMTGNHVLLECGNAVVLVAHLRPGSVAVKSAQHVQLGDRIGEVGNSGNSGEPHLHIHAQRAGSCDEPLSGEPLQIRIAGRYLVRNDRIVMP